MSGGSSSGSFLNHTIINVCLSHAPATLCGQGECIDGACHCYDGWMGENDFTWHMGRNCSTYRNTVAILWIIPCLAGIIAVIAGIYKAYQSLHHHHGHGHGHGHPTAPAPPHGNGGHGTSPAAPTIHGNGKGSPVAGGIQRNGTVYGGKNSPVGSNGLLLQMTTPNALPLSPHGNGSTGTNGNGAGAGGGIGSIHPLLRNQTLRREGSRSSLHGPREDLPTGAAAAAAVAASAASNEPQTTPKSAVRVIQVGSGTPKQSNTTLGGPASLYAVPHQRTISGGAIGGGMEANGGNNDDGPSVLRAEAAAHAAAISLAAENAAAEPSLMQANEPSSVAMLPTQNHGGLLLGSTGGHGASHHNMIGGGGVMVAPAPALGNGVPHSSIHHMNNNQPAVPTARNYKQWIKRASRLLTFRLAVMEAIMGILLVLMATVRMKYPERTVGHTWDISIALSVYLAVYFTFIFDFLVAWLGVYNALACFMPAAGVQPMTWIKHVFIGSYLGLWLFALLPVFVNLEYQSTIDNVAAAKTDDNGIGDGGMIGLASPEVRDMSDHIQILTQVLWVWVGVCVGVLMAGFIRLGSHLVTMLTLHLQTSAPGSKSELENVIRRLKLIVKCLFIGGSSFIPLIIVLVSWPWLMDRFSYFVPFWISSLQPLSLIIVFTIKYTLRSVEGQARSAVSLRAKAGALSLNGRPNNNNNNNNNNDHNGPPTARGNGNGNAANATGGWMSGNTGSFAGSEHQSLLAARTPKAGSNARVLGLSHNPAGATVGGTSTPPGHVRRASNGMIVNSFQPSSSVSSIQPTTPHHHHTHSYSQRSGGAGGHGHHRTQTQTAMMLIAASVNNNSPNNANHPNHSLMMNANNNPNSINNDSDASMPPLSAPPFLSTTSSSGGFGGSTTTMSGDSPQSITRGTSRAALLTTATTPTASSNNAYNTNNNTTMSSNSIMVHAATIVVHTSMDSGHGGGHTTILSEPSPHSIQGSGAPLILRQHSPVHSHSTIATNNGGRRPSVGTATHSSHAIVTDLSFVAATVNTNNNNSTKTSGYHHQHNGSHSGSSMNPFNHHQHMMTIEANHDVPSISISGSNSGNGNDSKGGSGYPFSSGGGGSSGYGRLKDQPSADSLASSAPTSPTPPPVPHAVTVTITDATGGNSGHHRQHTSATTLATTNGSSLAVDVSSSSSTISSPTPSPSPPPPSFPPTTIITTTPSPTNIPMSIPSPSPTSTSTTGNTTNTGNPNGISAANLAAMNTLAVSLRGAGRRASRNIISPSTNNANSMMMPGMMANHANNNTPSSP